MLNEPIRRNCGIAYGTSLGFLVDSEGQSTDLLTRMGLHAASLEGKVTVITGAARGIGAQAAQSLGRLGARMVLADINASGEEVAQALRSRGQSACFVPADVRDEAGIDRIIQEAQSQFGPIDIFINNAAHLRPGAILELPIADWDDAYRTHLRAAVIIAKRVLPGMLERRSGAVISLISLEGMAALAHYCASKMGLRSMMLSLAKELPPDCGVSVFSVVPGSVDTPLIHEIVDALSAKLGIPHADILASISNNPGYPGLVPVEHTAAALAWFCAHAAQFHGQHVDGYLPLSSSGIIHIDTGSKRRLNPGDRRLPNPETELEDLVRSNRILEDRIEERTRELLQAAAQLEAANQKLQLASLTDPLTGLWNRRYIDTQVGNDMSESRHRAARRFAVALVDIDHFKRVNDQHGHQAGDLVLQGLAALLRATFRASDKIARWGGEEFMVVLSDLGDHDVEGMVERLRQAVAAHEFPIGGPKTVRCTCSVGVALFPAVDLRPRLPAWGQMVGLADRCLYAAKANGRDAWIRLAVDFKAPESLDLGADSDLAGLVAQGHLTVACGHLKAEAIRW